MIKGYSGPCLPLNIPVQSILGSIQPRSVLCSRFLPAVCFSQLYIISSDFRTIFLRPTIKSTVRFHPSKSCPFLVVLTIHELNICQVLCAIWPKVQSPVYYCWIEERHHPREKYHFLSRTASVFNSQEVYDPSVFHGLFTCIAGATLSGPRGLGRHQSLSSFLYLACWFLGQALMQHRLTSNVLCKRR